MAATGGAVSSLLKFIVNLVMEQLSALWRHIINLIFLFSSRENSVSLISRALPLATLSSMHSSANLLWSNSFKKTTTFFSLYWISNLHSWDIVLTILHILVILVFPDELANFINIFINSIGHTKSKTQPFMLVPVLRQGPSGKAHLAFIKASFNQTILWSI